MHSSGHDDLRIIGIRHHSPACARWVSQCIDRMRPRFVLIEGPASFNQRIDELLLPHQLPIALYEYCQFEENNDLSSRAWIPFADWSPEWQALQAAQRHQAEIRFIDLPVWAYSKEEDSATDAYTESYEQALLRQTGMENIDALWDHLFEDEAQAEQLPDALDRYFHALRNTQAGSIQDQQRETFMAHWIAWAVAQRQGPVVVICGGWHKPALERLWPNSGSTNAPPETPVPPSGAAIMGSYLMPYSEKRLDVLTGYLSGMPAPSWQRWCWEQGQRQAGETLLYTIMSALRKKRQPASTADMGAAHLHALALAQLRGHTLPLRSDWLDALAGALIKEALDEPLPWSYRGTLHAGTNPILVAMVDELAGNRLGSLASDTPQPPLPDNVENELARVGITLPATLTLDRFEEKGLAQSQVLHRLRILEIPNVHCTYSSPSVLSADTEEQWQIQPSIHQRAGLIEASRFGATLEDAARQCLSLTLASANDLPHIAQLLNQAAMAGLTHFSQRVLDILADLIAQESRFEAVGSAIDVLYGLWRYDHQHSAIVQGTLQAALDRILWLAESTNSVDQAQINTHLHCWQIICHVLRDQQATHTPTHVIVHLPRALAVLERRSEASKAAPLIRGAALGALIRLEHPTATEASALKLLKACPPMQRGEALQGLIALARHQLTAETAFVAGFSQLIEQMNEYEFIQALPDLRAAFAWLPPQERGSLARQVLTYYQLPLHASQLTQPMQTTPQQQARCRHQEQLAMQQLRLWGVL